MCRFHTNRIFSRPSQVTSSLSKQPANLLQLLVDAKDCSENEDEGLSHMQGCPHIETSGEPLSAHPPFILVTHFPYHFSAYQSPPTSLLNCSSTPKIAVPQPYLQRMHTHPVNLCTPHQSYSFSPLSPSTFTTSQPIKAPRQPPLTARLRQRLQ